MSALAEQAQSLLHQMATFQDGNAQQHTIALINEQADLIGRLLSEVERLNKLLNPQWFYIDGWEEKCLFSTDEAIDLADFEAGYHILEVSTATSCPTIWCAVKVTDDDDADERFTFTEHASEAEALAALEALR